VLRERDAKWRELSICNQLAPCLLQCS